MAKTAKNFLQRNSTAIAMIILFNMGLAQMLLKVFIGSFASMLIMWSIMFVFYMISWLKTPNILTRTDVILLYTWMLFLVVSVAFMEKEQSVYMIITAKTIILGTALYFLGKMAGINCNEENYTSLLSWCPVIAAVLFMLILRVSVLAGESEIMYSEDATYSQYIGYILLPNLTIAIFLVLNGRKRQIPFMLILFTAVLSSGARGAIVCAVGAGVMTLCGKINLRSWKSWLLIVFISISAALLLLNYRAILIWLMQIFMDLNLSNRATNMLITGEFLTHSSGRTDFYKAAIKGINEYLFTGTGIYRDRQYLNEHFNGYRPLGFSNNSVGTYSHLILLDFPLQFGLFMGSFILLSLAIMILKVWRQTNKQSYVLGGGLIYVVLLSIGLFPLFVSRSWINHNNFYFMMGFIIERLKHKTILRGCNCEKYTLTENS